MFNNSNEFFMSKRLFSLALCLLIGLGTAFAQTVKVSGTVTDNNGDPVVSAAVQLKGSTSVYTMTDAVGEFSINVPGDGTLAVSCLGFTPTEVPVNGRSTVTIQLTVRCLKTSSSWLTERSEGKPTRAPSHR